MSFLSFSSFTGFFLPWGSRIPQWTWYLLPKAPHTHLVPWDLESPSGTQRHLGFCSLRAFAHTVLSTQTFINSPPTLASLLLSWLIPFSSGFFRMSSLSANLHPCIQSGWGLSPVFQKIPSFIFVGSGYHLLVHSTSIFWVPASLPHAVTVYHLSIDST